jgi:hypothetical protein
VGSPAPGVSGGVVGSPPAPPSVSSLSAGCTADCPILKVAPARHSPAHSPADGGANWVGWWVPPPLGSTEKLGRSTLGSDRGTAQRFYPYTAAGRPSLLHHLFLLSLLGALDCPILKMLPPPVTRLRTRQQTAGQTDFRWGGGFPRPWGQPKSWDAPRWVPTAARLNGSIRTLPLVARPCSTICFFSLCWVHCRLPDFENVAPARHSPAHSPADGGAN